LKAAFLTSSGPKLVFVSAKLYKKNKDTTMQIQ